MPLLLVIFFLVGLSVNVYGKNPYESSDVMETRFPDLTSAERMEAGLVDAVELAANAEAFDWSHIAEHSGDYQLGMAWIRVVEGSQVRVTMRVGNTLVMDTRVEGGIEPIRLERRFEGVEAGDTIAIRVLPDAGTRYEMGFHLALATPVFEGLEVFTVADFGALGDGESDDFAAVQRAVAAARSAGGGIIQFGAGQTYRVIGRDDMTIEAVFNLNGASNIFIQGNEATLILHPPDRLADISNARNIHIDGLKVDYWPLHYYQGDINHIDPENMTIDITVPDRYSVPEIGQPQHRGPYFGRSFIPHRPGSRAGDGDNIYVREVEQLGSERELRIHVRASALGSDTPDVGMYQRVLRAKQGGATELVMPHLRYAHHDGHTIIHNSGRVLLTNMYWSGASSFWLNIQDNIGPVTLRNVNLQVKHPETELFASWRDGMHIKNARFGMTIEDCDIDGAAMYDDVFAIYTRIHHIIGIEANRLEMRPAFRNHKDFRTWRSGDWVSIWNNDQTVLRGMSRLQQAEDVGGEDRFYLTIASLPPDTQSEDVLINEEVLNRNTLIRNCRIGEVGTSSATTRFRASDIHFENNDFREFSFTVEFNPFWGTPRSRGVYVRNTQIHSTNGRVLLQWPMGVHFENVQLHNTQLIANPHNLDVQLKDVQWIDAPRHFLNVGAGSDISILGHSTVDGLLLSTNPHLLRSGALMNPTATVSID
jgi:hypothetical protein